MKYFTLEELIYSDTATKKGIDNTPNSVQRKNLEILIDCLLDPIRELYGKPIKVNSGFRCVELNRAVGGVVNSEHLDGRAADLTVGTKEKNKELYNLIKNSQLEWRQLINESNYSWVHVSYNPTDNKRQVI